MVQPADSGERDDVTGFRRLDLPRFGAVLLKPQMRPRLGVVAEVLAEHTPEVILVHDHDVVEALAPYRADQPFDIGILPWRSRRRPHVLDLEVIDRSKKLRSIDRIAIPEQKPRSRFPWIRLDELASCPLRLSGSRLH